MEALYHLVGSFISLIVIFLVNCACIMSLHVSSIYLIEIYNIPFSWYSFFTLLWIYVHYYNVRNWELFISYIEFEVFCCDWLYYLLFRLLYCGCFWLVGFVGNLDGCLSCWLAVLVHFLVLCILAWSVLLLVWICSYGMRLCIMWASHTVVGVVCRFRQLRVSIKVVRHWFVM